MKTSIILINRDGGEWLTRALSSLRRDMDDMATTTRDFELLVVDNGSTDDSVARAERALAKSNFSSRFILEPVPGVNYSRNAGLRAATGDLLVFIDNDLTFEPGWLAAYLNAATAYPEQDVFAGRVLVGPVEGETPSWLDLTGIYSRPAIVGQADYGQKRRIMSFAGAQGPLGANMAIRRSLFNRVGPFDTRFGLRPGSMVPGAEAEFFRRLTDAGMSFVYVPEAAVHHPLKRSQVSKRYFLKRLHGIGRAHGRMQRMRHEQCARIFGVARYVVGDVVRATATWARSWLSGNSQQQFYVRGNLAIHLGHLHEEIVNAFGSLGGNPRDGMASATSQHANT